MTRSGTGASSVPPVPEHLGSADPEHVGSADPDHVGNADPEHLGIPTVSTAPDPELGTT